MEQGRLEKFYFCRRKKEAIKKFQLEQQQYLHDLNAEVSNQIRKMNRAVQQSERELEQKEREQRDRQDSLRRQRQKQLQERMLERERQKEEQQQERLRKRERERREREQRKWNCRQCLFIGTDYNQLQIHKSNLHPIVPLYRESELDSAYSDSGSEEEEEEEAIEKQERESQPRGDTDEETQRLQRKHSAPAPDIDYSDSSSDDESETESESESDALMSGEETLQFSKPEEKKEDIVLGNKAVDSESEEKKEDIVLPNKAVDSEKLYSPLWNRRERRGIVFRAIKKGDQSVCVLFRKDGFGRLADIPLHEICHNKPRQSTCPHPLSDKTTLVYELEVMDGIRFCKKEKTPLGHYIGCNLHVFPDMDQVPYNVDCTINCEICDTC
ncbi:MAG: hypothetical protein GY928_37340 [Colwellia sp.]|nr:hypothetical protein [Colwellia sp.]